MTVNARTTSIFILCRQRKIMNHFVVGNFYCIASHFASALGKP
jgi:hypothetical protein